MQREICCTKNILSKLLILMIFCIGITLSQNKIAQAKLLQDFDNLIEILESTHPDPYSPFGGKMSFHWNAKEYKSKISKEGMTEKEFYFLLSEFVATLEDGHTFITSPLKEKSKIRKILPLQLKIVASGLIVKSAAPEYSHLIGAEIREVNGVAADELLKKVRQLEPCENMSGAWFLLKKYLFNKDLFRQLFPETDNEIAIRFEIKKGTEQFRFPFIDKKEYSNFVNANNQKIATGKTLPFSYSFADEKNKIAHLKFSATYSREVVELIKSYGGNPLQMTETLYKMFPLGKKDKDQKKAVKNIPSIIEVFSKMLSEMKKNKSTHLIVDLRKNSGGWAPITLPTLYMLFGDKYLTYDCSAQYNTLISKRYLAKSNLSLEKYNKYRNTKLNLGDYNFGKFIDNGMTGIESREERIKQFIKNNSLFSEVKILENQNGEPVYSPKIIVVTSPATFSAAFQYLYLLQDICKAKVVGVSPRQAYNAGMESTHFTLENSNLAGSVSNSFQLFKPEDRKNGKILIPDFPFTKELFKKYKFDEDAEILYIKDLIKKNKL